MDIADMRKRFDDVISSMIRTKREDNKAYLNQAEYNARIAEVKQSKTVLTTPGSKKSVKNYRMVQKYDVLTTKGEVRLIKPVAGNSALVLFYVTNEELFDILHSIHCAIGHGGRNRMVAELKNKYSNITQEAIMAYLRLCEHCQRKLSNPKKVTVSKPGLQPTLNLRAQVGIIDMESRNYNDYRFIMIYLDHATQFVLLRAMKSKRSEEMGIILLEIFTTFGAPAILHSDNGREFVGSVLTELHRMWKDMKILNGKPRGSQSQVSTVTRDIEEMLSSWMAENNSRDWPTGLAFVQFHKNRAFHSGIGRPPFEAMFGTQARVGLVSTTIPYNEIANLNTEEDLDAAIKLSQDDQLVNASGIKKEVCEGDIQTNAYENNEATLEPMLVSSHEIDEFGQEKTHTERRRECFEKQAQKKMKLSSQQIP